MRMGRQIRFRDSKIRNAPAIIYRGIVILYALGNGSTELVPVVGGGDALSFRWIANESSFEQDGRNLDIPQDVKTRVPHTPIKRRNPRQNGSVNRSRQSDILAVERIAGVLFLAGLRGVVFAGGVRGHTSRRERVTFHPSAARGGVEMNAYKNSVWKAIGKIYPIFQGNTNVRCSGHLHSVTRTD